MNNQEVLVLSASLSALTYSLGALLLGLPLPFPSLKKLGSSLMKDAVFSMFIVALSSMLLSLPVTLYNRIGADWGFFDEWIAKRTLILSSLKAGASFASSLLSKVAGELALDSFLEPLIKSVNYSLLTLYLALSLSIIVRYHYAKLILLGILLSSIPMKLARGAGCYLIAFSIVFYAGMPLMPLFVEDFSTPLEYPDMNTDVVQGTIRVLDQRGVPVPYAVVSGYDLESGRLLFTYTTNTLGITTIKSPLDGLPRSRAYNLVVEVMGRQVSANPSVVEPALYEQSMGGRVELDVHLEDVVIVDERGVYLLVGNGSVSSISEEEGTKRVYLGEPGQHVLLVHPSTCYIDVDGPVLTRSTSMWNNILVVSNEIFVENTSEPIMISVKHCSAPSIDLYRPYTLSTGLSVKDRFAQTASQILLNYVVLPAVYVAILLSITSALAYTLSGARDKLPLKPW
jgi:hypothetical protein